MYSEPCQIPKMDFFLYENSERLSAVKYFNKISVLDVWQGSEYTSECTLENFKKCQIKMVCFHGKKLSTGCPATLLRKAMKLYS